MSRLIAPEIDRLMTKYSKSELRQVVKRADQLQATEHRLSRDDILNICEELGIAPDAAREALSEISKRGGASQRSPRSYSGLWAKLAGAAGLILGVASVALAPMFEGSMRADVIVPASLLASGAIVLAWKTAPQLRHLERHAANTAAWAGFAFAFFVGHVILRGAGWNNWLLGDAVVLLTAGWITSSVCSLAAAELKNHRLRSQEAAEGTVEDSQLTSN